MCFLVNKVKSCLYHLYFTLLFVHGFSIKFPQYLTSEKKKEIQEYRQKEKAEVSSGATAESLQQIQ